MTTTATAGSGAGEVLPAHSKIGASSMHRWAECPGSVKLSEGIESVSSVYAEEGTDAHELAAYRLTEGVYDRHPLANNEEMLEAVEVYIGYVEELARAPLSEVLVEHKFNLSEIYPGLFGTADAIVYDLPREILHVIDYKHGKGIPVEVMERDGSGAEHGNPQLMYYGVGALTSLLKTGKKVSKVVLHIVQPRCSHKDGPARKWETTPAVLLDFTMDLVELAERTTKKDAPLVSGDHCRFCPAKGICPKLTELSLETAQSEFSPVPAPAVFANGLPKTQGDGLAQLGELLHRLPMLEAWIEGVRAFAYAEAGHGRPIPGWKLVESKGRRKWADEEKAAEFLKAEYPVLIDRLFEPASLKSIAQVEKLLHKKQHEKLKLYTLWPKSGTVLVPESDQRPEVFVLTAQQEFKVIESPEEIDLFS